MNTENKDDLKNQIRDWWAGNPMTYGTVHGKTDYGNQHPDSPRIGTAEFFELADERFYSWNTPLHTTEKFGKIFDYERYRGKNVLEIGCGMGCMAMNWAQHGANVTAIDLNPIAIEQTKRRFKLKHLEGTIKEMDARILSFKNNSFDFTYSWGVLHHSPDIEKSIEEIFRVLKPGGQVGLMLYNRRSLLYRYTIELIEGLVHMENNFLTPLELASRYSDGGREEGNHYTWPLTKNEARQMLARSFSDIQIDVFGTDIEYSLDLAFPRLGTWLFPKWLQRSLGRRWGWSLWMTARKGA